MTIHLGRTAGRRGRTLIEEMMVLSVVAIVLAIAVVAGMRIKREANQRAALDTLRKIEAALERYRLARIPPTYPDKLCQLANSCGESDIVTGSAYAPMLDEPTADATTSGRAIRGHYFRYTPYCSGPGGSLATSCGTASALSGSSSTQQYVAYDLEAVSVDTGLAIPGGSATHVGIELAKAVSSSEVAPGQSSAQDAGSWDAVGGGIGKIMITW